MTRGVKVRLVAFLVLSAMGVVYVAGSFLGFTDRLLGRGFTMHATLPTSGGIFEGSEVTIRGVKVGEVKNMDVTPDGVRLDLAMEDGTKLPMASSVHVHNLSAVGEQYLDFEPPSQQGPYAGPGDTIRGDAESLPISEEKLLTQMDSLVGSLDGADLSTVVTELGTMFRGTANPLQRMVDSGSRLVDAASAHADETIELFDTGRTVLRTQADHEKDIRTFARDLADLTGSLSASDKDVRALLQGGPATVREVNALLKGLEPTLPVFLSNLVTVSQVLTSNLPGLEQTLVTFPRVISSGFSGTPGDGYGYINLQFNNNVPACSKGYKPNEDWRRPTDTSDGPVYPAKCLSGPPYNMRGTKYAPPKRNAGSTGRSYRVATYDAKTGAADLGNGRSVTMGSQGGLHSVFGTDDWKWLLIGPVSASE